MNLDWENIGHWSKRFNSNVAFSPSTALTPEVTPNPKPVTMGTDMSPEKKQGDQWTTSSVLVLRLVLNDLECSSVQVSFCLFTF